MTEPKQATPEAELEAELADLQRIYVGTLDKPGLVMHLNQQLEDRIEAQEKAEARVMDLEAALRGLLEWKPSIDPEHTILNYDSVHQFEEAEAERKAWAAAEALLVKP
jgi:hypothetical protein